MADALFVHHREPNPEWQRHLDVLCHRAERLNWLKILWEPGDPWAPVQRWEIREMLALDDRLGEDLRLQLLEIYRGPHPRQDGHWIGEGETRRWHSNQPVSKTQYELYHETGCHSLRVWVVQGEKGGHPFELSHAEQKYLRNMGYGITDTPPPGALPYAEPTEMTWSRLAAMDKMRGWAERLAWDQRQYGVTQAGLIVARQHLAEEQLWGARLIQYLDDSITGALDNVADSALPDFSDLAPPDECPVTGDPDQLTEELAAGVTTPRPGD